MFAGLLNEDTTWILQFDSALRGPGKGSATWRRNVGQQGKTMGTWAVWHLVKC